MDIARTDPIAGALRRIKENPTFGRGDEIAVGLENGAASKIGRRTNLCLSRSSSRRGPLYPSTSQRRDVAKITSQLFGVARFQSPLFHSERCRRSDSQIRNRLG